MRFFNSATLPRSLCWLVLAMAATLHAQDAANSPDRKSISDFVNSVAQTVYKMAWPSATYRSVSLDGIDPIDGGLNVLVTLDGVSGLDQSGQDQRDLWVQLVFVLRNGSLEDVRVKNDNHILFPPFATTKTLANAAEEMAKEYAAQQQANSTNPATSPAPAEEPPLPDPFPTPKFYPFTPDAPALTPPAAPDPPPARRVAPPTTLASPPALAPPPLAGVVAAEAVCLINSTGHAVTFDYRWGVLKWIQYELASNQEVKIWWPRKDEQRASPPLAIRYDDDFAPGYTERSYTLLRTPTALPVDCSRVQNYRFTMSGSKIVVSGANP